MKQDYLMYLENFKNVKFEINGVAHEKKSNHNRNNIIILLYFVIYYAGLGSNVNNLRGI